MPIVLTIIDHAASVLVPMFKGADRGYLQCLKFAMNERTTASLGDTMIGPSASLLKGQDT